MYFQDKFLDLQIFMTRSFNGLDGPSTVTINQSYLKAYQNDHFAL